jgi:hypothetical protein
VGHASRSSGFLHVEASLARVFQSGLKTDADATASGARGTIIEVTSEAPCYPTFVVFNVLGLRGIIVI